MEGIKGHGGEAGFWAMKKEQCSWRRSEADGGGILLEVEAASLMMKGIVEEKRNKERNK